MISATRRNPLGIIPLVTTYQVSSALHCASKTQIKLLLFSLFSVLFLYDEPLSPHVRFLASSTVVLSRTRKQSSILPHPPGHKQVNVDWVPNRYKYRKKETKNSFVHATRAQCALGTMHVPSINASCMAGKVHRFFWRLPVWKSTVTKAPVWLNRLSC